MSNIRVRIAPSNTGSDVHIGNIRTALFNYLFAKQNKGSFVFRIENSDIARSKDEYADAIGESLKWLGLVPDEGYKCDNQDHGPYLQTEKLERYKQVAEQLIASGHAYRCYCTAEELADQKENNKDKNGFSKYRGVCRDRKDQPTDREYVVRFKAPTEGKIIFEDKVFGKLTIPNIENYDFVIMRSNGIPIYNFGCVVDDIDQKITHVIRGRDHLVNCVPQILLYMALGANIPVFAHLPMLNNQSNQKLSKRDGSVTIREYKNAGYSPNAILNYLAKFGWGMKNQEIFTINELIQHFSLESCGRGDGKFDPIKFSSINYEHLKSEVLTPDDKYAELLKPFIDGKNIGDFSIEQLMPFIKVIRSRSRTFVEAANYLEPILKNEAQASPELMTQTFNDVNTDYLKKINEFLKSIDNWTELYLRDVMQQWFKQENLSLKLVGAPLRVALLGQSNSPELFTVLGAMGKTKSLNRISKTLESLS